MRDVGRLTILPAFGVRKGARAGIVLARKFLAGVEEYVRQWGGPVRVVVEEGAGQAGNMDEVEIAEEELPFELKVARYDGPEMRRTLEGSAVALLALHYRQLSLCELCASMSIPAVYVSEYSLRTQLQMLAVSRVNPVVRLRRTIWLLSIERQARRVVRKAAEKGGGVQCNGTPTYEAYRGIAKESLLYFDTRVREKILADEATLERRTKRLREKGILRLAYSGRLMAMKGADHLVPVAKELKRRGVKFSLAICGGGELEAGMRKEVAAMGLSREVVFKGVMDFERELLPFVRDEVDVFVCCHRQGDPSCTYLETMSCGVPIAGYDNEAFRGVVAHSAAGWLTAMNRPAELAARIAKLNTAEILEHARRALSFAREHTFEKTFGRRVEQLKRIAERSRATERVYTFSGIS
ncbi:MAG: glycosyltransferase [Phycisphaerales bacterium]|nr:glycosyltransferase [Phycisphaerales bacterium]